MRLLVKYGMPVTRENFINLAYFGEPPAEWSAEDEANLPPQLQLKEPRK